MVRWLTIGVIAGLLVIAALLDREDRDFDEFPSPLRGAVAVAAEEGGTWYCPGGSGPADPGGIAGVGLEIVNAGDEPAAALVTAMQRSSLGPSEELEVIVDPAGRTTVALGALAPAADWVGAVVEVSGSDVVVEQTFAGPTGSDRVPCATQSASRWMVPSGATRVESDGEQMVMLLLNPFPDDAIVDIAYDSDVSVDSVEGVVVPARSLVPVDVTRQETGVTVASRVSAVLDVVAGRIVVSRVQTYDGESARGLAVTPGAAGGAAVWYLTNVERVPDRRDVLSVTNPGATVAEVDVEILADTGPTGAPIELTVRPGRTVQVDLAVEARLEGLSTLSLVARSLSGTPIAVGIDSVVDPATVDPDLVVGAGAMVGSDLAADRWLVALDGGDVSGSVVVVNPAPTAIATVEVATVDEGGTSVFSTVELGPGRRAVIDVGEVGVERALVLVEASAPVVVGRETAGLTSRSLASGVIAGAPVAFADLS